MGDCLHGNEFGMAEGCTRDNWAAEYAKKLFGAEASARKNADETLQKQITDNKSAIEKEASDRDDAISKALHKEIDRVDPIIESSCRQAVLDAKRYTDDEVGNAATHARDERNRIENDVIARLANRVTETENAIKQEVSDRRTAVGDEIEARQAEDSALVERILKQEIYSTTPTQVGWWIDGTPIWRVVFRKLGEDISNYMIENTFQFDIREYLENNIIKSADDCRIINSAIFVGVEGSLEYEVQLDNGAYSYIKQKELSETQRFESNDVYGWIEFTSVLSNFNY